MSNKVYMHAIATQVPGSGYSQKDILAFMLESDNYSASQKQFLTMIYEGSAIDKRYSVIKDYRRNPTENDPYGYTFFEVNGSGMVEPSLVKRNKLFITEANKLSLQAVNKLLLKLPEFKREQITHLITVSCTGFSAPGFDFYLTKTLNLRRDLHRLHIGFMGCYAAFPALKMAHTICLAHPEARVLIVNVELCSLHLQLVPDRDFMVANALFADGISAALVSACAEDGEGHEAAGRYVLQSFTSHYLDNSEKDMAWEIGEKAFDMRLSAYVPRLIEKNLGKVAQELFSKAGITHNEIALWAIHPGGVSILKKLEKAFELQEEDLHDAYAVLREYGNMSSATIMFVLENMLINNKKFGPVFAAAFGPGLTVETAYLSKEVC